MTYTPFKTSQELNAYLDRVRASIRKAKFEAAESELSIHVPASSKYGLVEGVARFGDQEILCVVASPCLRGGNILDDFGGHLPRDLSRIGLVTFQNGIMNSEKNFLEMAQLVFKQLPGTPLVIGLYNPTKGLGDYVRQFLHLQNRPVFSETALRTRHFLKTITEQLGAARRSLKWLHIMHSEAGALGHLSLDSFSPRLLSFTKARLVTAAYGPLFPISSEWVLDAYNTYSDRDSITGLIGDKFLKHRGYEDVSIVPCLDEEVLKFVSQVKFGRLPDDHWNKSYDLVKYDHGFAGPTYQAALSANIDNIKDAHSFS